MKRICTVLVSAFMVMIGVSTCGGDAPASDISNYWRTNSLPIIVNLEEVSHDTNSYREFDFEKECRTTSSPEIFYKVLDKERKNVKKFFFEKYGLDVDLEDVRVRRFTQGDDIFQNLGYYSEEQIFINGILMDSEYIDMLPSVMRHELIHAAGVNDEEDECIVEGLVQVLTEECSNYVGARNYMRSEDSSVQINYLLAEQILEANRGLVSRFINDRAFDFSEHVNQMLKDTPQQYGSVEDVAIFLEKCTECAFGTGDTADRAALQTQYIIGEYCKAFHPSYEQIKKIRKNYVFTDFEEIEIGSDVVAPFFGAPSRT